jgi:hypothetical protein
MLRTMTEMLGEVCSVTRRLLRRGLGLQTSKSVNVFLPAKGRILFEQASYSVADTLSYFFHDFVILVATKLQLQIVPDQTKNL